VARRSTGPFSGPVQAAVVATRPAHAPPLPPGAAPDRQPERSAVKTGLVLFGVVLAFYLSAPNVTNTDAYLAVPTAVSLVHSANLNLDEFRSPLVKDHYGYVALNGQHFDRYPWTDSLFFVPGVVVVDVLHRVGLAPGATNLVESNRMGPLQLVTASVVTALAAVVVFALALELLGGPPLRRRRTSLVVGLVFALATSAWSTASRALWQHGPSMLALALALVAASRLERGYRPRRMAVLLGVAVAAAYAIRPTNVIAVVAFGAFVAFGHRRWLGAYLSGVAGVLGPFAAVNVASFGRLLPPYYSAGRISLHPAYLEALAANLFSPARGLFVFCPVVGLGVAGFVLQVRARRVRSLEVVVAACVVAQLLLVSAQNEGWWAGHAFGPRFMSDVLPMLVYLSIPAVEALHGALRSGAPTLLSKVAVAGTGLAVVCGVAVNAEGAYLRSSTCWNAEPVSIDLRPSRVWDMHDPQVLAGFRAMARNGPWAAMVGPCPGAAGVAARSQS
jgi:hypothetical protein